MKITMAEIFSYLEEKKMIGKITPIERWEEFSLMYEWAGGNVVQVSREKFEIAILLGWLHEECTPCSNDDTFRFGRDDTYLGKRVVVCL